MLVESTEVTVPVSDSLMLVTPACFTLTVEPVVIGNVEVPCNLDDRSRSGSEEAA